MTNWIEQRRLPCIWYRVDAGDADAATLFSNLVMSVARHRKGGKGLPYLSGDYRRDLATFAGRFFRAYFQFLAPGSVLVFDNLHEAAGSELHSVLCEAIRQVPPEIVMVIITRHQPPAEVTGQWLNHEITVIGWEDLRFDREEVANLLARRTPAEGVTIQTLVQDTDGWVAGLVLLLNHSRRDRRYGAPSMSDAKEILFRYFAAEVFHRLPAEHQHVLMCASLLPQATPSAAATLSGSAVAGKVLDQLYRMQYFTDRVFEPELSYRFHDLFRQFLQDQASQFEGAPWWAEKQSLAADILLHDGEHDLAVLHFQRISAWPRIAAVIGRQAGMLLRQGRWQTLLNWLGLLPSDMVDANAWLLYWLGIATAVTDARLGRATVARAANMFCQHKDDAGAILASSTMVDLYFQEWDLVAELDPWLDRLMEGLAPGGVQIDEEIRCRAETSLVIGLVFRRPGEAVLPGLAERLVERAPSQSDNSERLRQFTILLVYLDLMGDFTRAYALFRKAVPLVRDVTVAPRLRIWAVTRQFHHHAMSAEYPQALEHAETAFQLSRETGVAIAPAMPLIQQAHALMEAGRAQDAWAWIEQARPLISPRYAMEAVLFYWLELWVVVAMGDLARAYRLWDAFSGHPVIGVPFNTAYNHPAIYLLAERGETELALDRVRRWRTMLAGMGSPLLNFNLDLMESFVQLRHGADEEATATLARALATGSAHGFFTTLAWLPDMIRPLLAHALKSGLQTDYVEAVIRRRDLRPSDSNALWPWPIKIFALGRFLVLKDGTPIRFTHGPQPKTLELLKAIIATGTSGARVADLIDRLWPDSDGDAGHNALGVTLSRLRKLLGGVETLVMETGRVRLNEQRCWVDAFAFDREVTAHLSAGSTGTGWDGVLRLYRGHFLGEESDAPWALTLRDRLRAKYQRAVLAAGRALEEGQRWKEAADVYRGSLDIDNLQEDIYRCLMRVLMASGETAEALNTFRRCRELLSIVLGVTPSPETESLVRAVRQAQAAPDA